MSINSEHGFATHFVESRRIPALLERLAALETPTHQRINALLEEARSERDPEEVSTAIVGAKREALDAAFSHNTVEKIVAALQDISSSHRDEGVRQWAVETLEEIDKRSPTSLKVALAAIRRGKHMTLLDALQMEMNIATAFCVSDSESHLGLLLIRFRGRQSGVTSDFHTGVTAVLVEKTKARPNWSPARLEDVDDGELLNNFFSKYTPDNDTAPRLTPPSYVAPANKVADPMQFALPSEAEIRSMVDGSHRSSGATEITLDELLAKFDGLRAGKSGVREKILEVVQRKCAFEEDKHMDKQWLKWKH